MDFLTLSGPFALLCFLICATMTLAPGYRRWRRAVRARTWRAMKRAQRGEALKYELGQHLTRLRVRVRPSDLN